MKEGYFDIYEWLGNLGFSKELQAEFVYADALHLFNLLARAYYDGRTELILTVEADEAPEIYAKHLGEFK